MFVRFNVIGCLIISLSACNSFHLNSFGPGLITGSLDALGGAGVGSDYRNNYNCTSSLLSSDVCAADTKHLSTAKEATVCGKVVANCHKQPIEQTTDLTRRCYSSNGTTGFCWFEDPNT
ncbi:hypothetical protein [Kiloniella majae]|uniref:hypothetical protein n=1 Tax=Kiloniella majae TaxID=1938558 RepID=UPI000A277406|nr:hypothetical protein [Kiloniella majae]